MGDRAPSDAIAARAIVLDPDDRILLVLFRQSAPARGLVGHARRRARRGRDARGGAPPRAARGGGDRGADRPVRVDAGARVRLGGALHPPDRALLRRARGVRRGRAAARSGRGGRRTSSGGGRSPSSRPPTGAVRAAPARRSSSASCSRTGRRPSRSTPASIKEAPDDPADHARSLEPGEVADPEARPARRRE